MQQVKELWRVHVRQGRRGGGWKSTEHRRNIWWHHGKGSVRVHAIYGCLGAQTRWETGAETHMLSVKTCALAPSWNTAHCQMLLIPVLASIAKTHVAWLSATVLYHFICAICVPSKFYQPRSLCSVEMESCWQHAANPMTCHPWRGSVIVLHNDPMFVTGSTSQRVNICK